MVMRPSSSSSYRPSSSGSANRSYRGGSNRNSPRRSDGSGARGFTGFITVGGIALVGYIAYGVVSVVFDGSSFGLVAAVLVSVVPLTVSASNLFRAFEKGKVTVLLYPALGLAVSLLVPGLAPWVASSLVALAVVHTGYLLLRLFIGSRTVAIVIAALPIIGASFYVPAAIDRAGCVFTTATDVGPSPESDSQKLTRIMSSLGAAYGHSAVLHPRVVGNRILVDIRAQGMSTTIVLEATTLVQTPFRWLERRLDRQLEAATSSTDDSQIAAAQAVLSPLAAATNGYDTVMLADGTPVNLSYARMFPGKTVLRSVSLDQDMIARNAAALANSSAPSLAGTIIFNALPVSRSETEAAGLLAGDALSWQAANSEFKRIVSEVGAESTAPTKAAILDSLATKEATVLIVAHSDGFSVRLPSGEAIEVKDLEAMAERIRANKPKVFLFSCDTARVASNTSFAKALLDAGASAVVAPVGKLSVAMAAQNLQLILGRMTQRAPNSPHYPFALDAMTAGPMEVWIAMSRSGSRAAARAT